MHEMMFYIYLKLADDAGTLQTDLIYKTETTLA